MKAPAGTTAVIEVERKDEGGVTRARYLREDGERVLVFDAGRFGLRAEDGGAALTPDELRRLAECACALTVQEHDMPPERSVVVLPAIFLERALADARRAQENLTHVQARCTALLEEVREAKEQLVWAVATQKALLESQERLATEVKLLKEMHVSCDVCGGDAGDGDPRRCPACAGREAGVSCAACKAPLSGAVSLRLCAACRRALLPEQD